MRQLSSRRAIPTLAISLAVLASACGGAGSAPNTAEAAAAGDTAATAQDTLQPSDDVRLFEVLDVRSGEASSLRAAVDGDRPVLLWFYAPH